jgi:nucleoside-diphosphate-sugar epimerase
MKIALTGSTGFIGSHILDELLANGHSVTALVQGDGQADAIRSRGAEPVVVDVYDPSAVVKVLEAADGAVHTASPGDETSAAFDAAVVDAAVGAYATTGKPFAYISGAWIFGDNTAITDDSPIHAPAMVAWKEAVQDRLLGETGMRGIVVVSSVAYGDGGGAVPGAILGSPRDDAGNLIMVGSGRQHWSNVHVADLAHFFRLALESDSARGTYVIGNGQNPTVAEITEAAAVAVGAPGAVPGSNEEARTRFGDYFAEVLLLDQAAQSKRAQAELGWSPTRAGLVEDYRSGSYRK